MNARFVLYAFFVYPALIMTMLASSCARTGFVSTCRDHDDCANNAVCRENYCRLTCNYNRDCDTDERCNEGACMPFLVLADAGMTDIGTMDREQADTSLPDTSLPDTSLPDTSTPDTNLPDTSTPDTSTPDTSTPDTSTPDTSTPDTSLPDTSTPDTSTPDTSLPDTSTPDTSTPDTSTPDTSTPDTSTPDSAAPATQLAVFVTAPTYTGDLGGISGADIICNNAAPPEANLSNIHALLCAFELDLVNMPARLGYDTNTPISWYNDSTHELHVFASNWSDMLDAEINISIATATGYTGEVWSGCSSDGGGDDSTRACSYNPTACACGTATGSANKWIVGTSSGYAGQGDVTQTNGFWLSDPCPGWGDCSCNNLAHLMCIGERAL